MNTQAREIELMDFLLILWKRKWFVLLLTLIVTAAAVVFVLISPKRWEVSTVMVPSKFLVQMEGGKFEEVVFVDPKQIAGQINQGSYSSLIVSELNLSLHQLPEIKAENLKDTTLVKISIREKDVEEAKNILRLLLGRLISELNQKADIEIKNTDTLIKTREIEKNILDEEVKTSQKKVVVIKQREKAIENEMENTRKRIEALDAEQRASLKKEKTSETESLAMLLYSNEIQQSLRYHDALNELLNSKRIEEEDLNLKIGNNAQLIKQKDNEIANLTERKGRIEYAQVKREPSAPLNPLMQRSLIVFAAFLMGLAISILMAFFLEYLEKSKAKT